jgi:hypothetical protein
VRPSRLLAIAALTAALALVVLPDLAGSRSSSSASIVDSAAFQPIPIPASAGEHPTSVGPLDPSLASAGRITATTAFVEPGKAPERTVGRPAVFQPAALGGSAQKPPRYKLTGYATFYDNGTTAMRLPRGTPVIICGKGGCIERIITDSGPADFNQRIVDLYTPDFFDVCGCPSWAGTTWVTVSVY